MASRSWGVGEIRWTPGAPRRAWTASPHHGLLAAQRRPLRRVAVIRSAVDEEEGRLKRVVEEFDVDASTTLAQLKENIGAQLGVAPTRLHLDTRFHGELTDAERTLAALGVQHDAQLSLRIERRAAAAKAAAAAAAAAPVAAPAAPAAPG